MSIITIHARLCREENSDGPPRQSHPLPAAKRLAGPRCELVNITSQPVCVCVPNPRSMSNSCPSLPKSPRTDSCFDLPSRSVAALAPSKAFTRCWRIPPQPRTVRSASVRSAASQHIRRQPLLELPFNQGCFLETASPPRFHWKREGGESRIGAILLDHRPVDQL